MIKPSPAAALGQDFSASTMNNPLETGESVHMEDCCIVYVTCPSENAEKISRALLEQRLVACANIVSGMKSLYWWEGRMDSATESLLMLKTKRKLLGKLEQEVKIASIQSSRSNRSSDNVR